MKIGNVDGRAVLFRDDEQLDIATASGRRFIDDRDLFERWTEFREWIGTNPSGWVARDQKARLGAPVRSPRQVFGVGLNYGEHRDEVAAAEGYGDSLPLTFTKFPSSICGPTDDIELSSRWCDYEVELVIVVGVAADRIDPADGWDHVAGLTIGQDISDRRLQYADPNQLSLAKSMRTFSPIGPVVVTRDELEDPDNIEFSCRVNGEERQHSTTGLLLRNVPAVVSFLSGFTTLLPGDLIFSGTPTGIGHRMSPPRFLRAGDLVVSTFAGIGEMHNRCVEGYDPTPQITTTRYDES